MIDKIFVDKAANLVINRLGTEGWDVELEIVEDGDSTFKFLEHKEENLDEINNIKELFEEVYYDGEDIELEFAFDNFLTLSFINNNQVNKISVMKHI